MPETTKYITVARCGTHNCWALTLDETDADGAGRGRRITQRKCCGSWPTAKQWPIEQIDRKELVEFCGGIWPEPMASPNAPCRACESSAQHEPDPKGCHGARLRAALVAIREALATERYQACAIPAIELELREVSDLLPEVTDAF